MSGTTSAPAASPEAGAPTPPSWRRIPVLTLGLTALLAVMLTAFILPSINSGPHDVPIAVAGPREAAEEVAARLEQAQPDAFAIRVLADEEAARADIDDRDIYGAVIVGEEQPRLLIASAASAQIAGTLTALGPTLSGDPAAGSAVTVEDLYPLPEEDPRGSGLSAGAMPLVLGGYIAAVAIVLTVRPAAQRVAAAFGFSVLGGFALTALLQYGFDLIGGNYLLTSVALSYVMAATCWGIIGLRGLLGGPGLAVGAALMILVGNPLSGLSGGKEWLPTFWGDFGQFLPPGAGGSLLRSMAYFDGAGILPSLLVLTGWLIAGFALFLFGLRKEAAAIAAAMAERAASQPRPDAEAEPARA